MLHQFQHIPSLMQFTLTDNSKFSWLWNFFKQYFEDWFVSIKQEDGNFSKTEWNKIFISQETHKELKITVSPITWGSTSSSTSSQIHDWKILSRPTRKLTYGKKCVGKWFCKYQIHEWTHFILKKVKNPIIQSKVAAPAFLFVLAYPR